MPALRSVVAAVVLTAAMPLALVTLTVPVAAAPCSDTGGVSVVVDFHDLGGGAQSVCDASGAGQKASTLFTRNRFDLTYAQRQPGYVCRVGGVPASDPCINTSPSSAYWGLWWSDGTSGSWSYSALGVQSLTIPAGGSVAFAWDDVNGDAKPGVAPPQQVASPTPSPTPTPSPSPAPTHGPSHGPTHSANPTPAPAVSSNAAPTPTPTLAQSASPSKTPSPSGTASATPSPTSSATPTAGSTPQDEGQPLDSQPVDQDDGLPPWIPIALIVGLLAAAAVIVVRRRAGG